MSEHDLEKLLGAFSADTLTPEERQQLYAAALQDQQLFNALADEQALKEMLADPAVRRRLLRTLAQPRSTGSRRSWMDRFTTPAGLAWAGGLAVGVFAVVLGLRVYEESLRQASETAALEEVKPPAPSTAPPAIPPASPPLKNSETKASKAAPLPERAAKDATASASNTRERVAASRPQQGPLSAPKTTEKRESSLQKKPPKLDAPVGALGKSTEKPAPSAPASELDLLAQEKTAAPAISVSARALFYGQAPVPEISLRAQAEVAEPAPKTDQFALARKAPQSTQVVKPLGLRYSFVVESKGETSEVNPAFVADQAGTVTLTVESNQEAYIQIWMRAGEALPELVLPGKETGRISLKSAAGQRQLLTVPTQSDRLIIRLSRVPFGPITRQEAVMAGRGLSTQLTESSSTDEQAIYVANPDLSAGELAIEIPLGTDAAR